MKGFILSLYSEFYKSRKTLGFWAAILLPLILTTLVFIGFYLKHNKFDNMPGLALWGNFTAPILGIMGTLLLPMFIIIVAYSTNSIEHRSDTWKTLFSLPISKWSVYSAKYLYTLLLVFTSLTLFVIFNIAYGNLLSVLVPTLKFNEYHMEAVLAQVYFKLFLSGLGILSVQFLLSLLWADFLKPLGIGFLLTIVADILTGPAQWKYAYLIPYSHPMLALQSMFKRVPGQRRGPNLEVDLFTHDVYVSLVVFAAVFVLGFFVVQKKSVK